MKNDNMKKNGQFLNVRVEYGFGAVWTSGPPARAATVVRLTRSLLDPELFPHTAYVKIFATLARKTVN